MKGQRRGAEGRGSATERGGREAQPQGTGRLCRWRTGIAPQDPSRTRTRGGMPYTEGGHFGCGEGSSHC